ncbi:MAG TPA: antibiotic biosynthesis monooxygenase [Ktedonobacteraceae bacterium]
MAAITVGLLVRLEAKPGRETDVEKFLQGGLALVQNEPETAAWFAIRLGKSTFGIFDVFSDEAGRKAHLAGKVATALMEKAPELLAQDPKIEMIEVIATKLPY